MVPATRKRAAGTDAEVRGRDASVWSGLVLLFFAAVVLVARVYLLD
jgi:4-amino-4-deoxy-L-arabinose transferase-like glycosyltransferase